MMTSHFSKNRENSIQMIDGKCRRFLVDEAYLKEPVVNAFQVVSFMRKKRHFQPRVK